MTVYYNLIAIKGPDVKEILRDFYLDHKNPIPRLPDIPGNIGNYVFRYNYNTYYPLKVRVTCRETLHRYIEPLSCKQNYFIFIKFRSINSEEIVNKICEDFKSTLDIKYVNGFICISGTSKEMSIPELFLFLMVLGRIKIDDYSVDNLITTLINNYRVAIINDTLERKLELTVQAAFAIYVYSKGFKKIYSIRKGISELFTYYNTHPYFSRSELRELSVMRNEFINKFHFTPYNITIL